MSDHTQSMSDDNSNAELAVFADAQTLPALTDMLQRLARSTDHMVVGGIEQAMQWLNTHPLPSALLVDISEAAYPLHAFNELAALCGPGCKIILLGKTQDINLYRNLLQAGALDYLIKPCTLDVLASTLARIADEGNAMTGHARAGRTIAISGVAGGIGASTVTAGLGLLFANQHQLPSILVDGDRSKGDLPLLLGSDADAGLASLLSANAIDPRLLQRSIRPVDTSNRLHFLAQQAGQYSDVDPERVLELGSMLTQMFSLCLWDLPAAATPGVPEVLEHADVRIVLTDLSVQHARHARRLVQQYGKEQSGQRFLLVANAVRSAERSGISQAQFEDFVGHAIDVSLPHAGNALDGSLLVGPLNPARHAGFQLGLQQLAAHVIGKPVAGANIAPLKNSWLPAWLTKPAKPVSATVR